MGESDSFSDSAIEGRDGRREVDLADERADFSYPLSLLEFYEPAPGDLADSVVLFYAAVGGRERWGGAVRPNRIFKRSHAIRGLQALTFQLSNSQLLLQC